MIRIDATEVLSYFQNVKSKSDPTTILMGLRERYRRQMDPRYNQIEQTPFSPVSLKMGRTPGTFANLTGRLREDTINGYLLQGDQITLGPTLEYADTIDQILRRKGPFAPEGLVIYTDADLDEDAAAISTKIFD